MIRVDLSDGWQPRRTTAGSIGRRHAEEKTISDFSHQIFTVLFVRNLKGCVSRVLRDHILEQMRP